MPKSFIKSNTHLINVETILEFPCGKVKKGSDRFLKKLKVLHDKRCDICKGISLIQHINTSSIMKD